MITKRHHFFLLNFRPWPLISRINSFRILFSLLLFFKFRFYFCFLCCLLNITLTSFFWWFCYRGEFNLEGLNSNNLERGIKFSMLLFISSEVFFFFSFFWSYFHFFLSPSMETGLFWPPYAIEMFDCLNVPLINTLVLISSGVTVTISHHYLINGKKVWTNFYLALTIILGIIFTYLQSIEYLRSFFRIGDGTFGTSFFILTGFHGIHVLIGTIFLIIVFYRSINLISRKIECLSFELASWYWHFVDVVWIFLYFIIYYLNN